MKKDMRDGWTYKKLGEVCEILNGYAFDSSCFTEDSSQMPIIRIRDIKRGYTETFYSGAFSNEYIIKKGDFLIGMDGEFAIESWKGKDSLLNQRVCKISTKDESLLSGFLYWFMPKQLKVIEDATPFVTVKHLSSKKLLNIDIPLPPLSTQQQIVSELDLLTHILEQKRQQLKEYDALAESIFYDMFGDPVENPKGWEKKTIGDFFFVKGGKRIPKGMDYATEPTSHPYLRASDMKNNTILDDDMHYITDEVFQKIKKYTVSKQDVYFTNVGVNLGMAGVIPDKYDGANLTENAVKFEPKGKCLVNSDYLSRYLNSKSVQSYLDTRKMTVGVPKLAIFRIESIPLILPPLPLQQTFAAKIQSIEHQKQLLKESIKETEMLFQSRMDYWFNG